MPAETEPLSAPSTLVEGVLSWAPFRMVRRARWNECDPAGVVHAGRYTDYVYAAVELYLSDGLGISHALKREAGVRTPVRSLTLIFSKPIRPGDVFEMFACISAVTSRSFRVGVEGLSSGVELFSAEVALVVVDEAEGRAIPIPDLMRVRLVSVRTQE